MKHFRKQSLRTRLTVFFVVMSIIPAAVLGVAALRLFSNNLESNEIQSNQHVLEFLDYRLNQVISGIHKTVLLTAYDANVRSYFLPEMDFDADARATIEQMAKRQIISLQQREDADSVLLIGQNGNALVYSKANFARVSEVDRTDYQPQDESCFRIHAAWGKPRRENDRLVLPYERIVLGMDGTSHVARLVVNYPETVFSSLFTRYGQANQATFCVLDQEGTVMSCTDESLVGVDALDFGLDVKTLTSTSGSLHLDGYLYCYLVNPSDGYVLVEREPLSVFMAMFRPVLFLMLGISGIGLFVCLALGALLSHSMTKPLYALIDRVSDDPTSASHASVARYRDEFAILSDQYDEVINRLETSIADYYEE